MSPTSPDSQAIETTGRSMCRLRRTLAYDAFDSILRKPLHHGEGLVFPQFVESARGCEFTDTTGQTFIDWVIGGGPVLLGHRREEVEAAIVEQLHAGPTLSLSHPIELEVAETLTEMIPNAEMVAFGKNGSDCLTAAVRLARAITGRELIVQYGMHGFHDWYVVHNPVVRGVPQVLKPLIQTFQYNDLEGLEELLNRFEGQVAGIMMEPVREILPEPGYLEAVRELARRHGALFLWDEVVTAFRLGHGGAQDYLGVQPDIACLGKAMGNGMPLSAIVGRREFMSQLPGVAFGMTFRGETLSLAAARATLKILRTEPVAEHVAAVGTRVRDGFEALCRRFDLTIGLGGPPARMTFIFPSDGGLTPEELQQLFVQECLKRGVFTNGNILPSYAHDDAAVERTLSGFEGALEVIAEAVHAGRRALESGSSTPAPGPRAAVSIGYIEDLRRRADGIAIGGWSILGAETAEVVELVTGGGSVIEAQRVERTDVAAAYPDIRGGAAAGYCVLLPASCVADGGAFEFTLRFHRPGHLAFLCRVVVESPPGADGVWPGPHWTGDGILYL